MDGYSSSSEDDEDSQHARKKKSPKRRGRPKCDMPVGAGSSDVYNYDTNLSSDNTGGIKMKFSKNEDFDFHGEDENDLKHQQMLQHHKRHSISGL